MSTSLAHLRVGSTLIIVQLHGPILDHEWNELLEALRVGDHTGVVIWAKATAPDQRQRNVARESMNRRTLPKVPFAVFSESVVIRGAVGIMSLFMGDRLKMFAPADVDKAFAHAKVDPANARKISETIEELKKRPPQSAAA